MEKKPTIALVITHFGPLPSYLDYFLHSCASNKNLDFWIFTDQDFSEYTLYSNIKFVSFSLDRFNELATHQLGRSISVKNGYKLCDFKPAYGLIYESYLLKYDFWGFCDTDIILGDTSKVLTTALLASYDVISSHPQYIAGPFCLFRNSLQARRLFLLSQDIDRVCTEDRTLKFCEASSVISKLWEGYNVFDFPSEIESMTHIALNSKKNSLRVLLADIIVERVRQKLVWEDGLLFDGVQEVAIFHFITYKGKLSFNVPPYKAGLRFYFNQHGFFLDSFKSRTYDWTQSAVHNFSHKAKRKVRMALAK